MRKKSASQCLSRKVTLQDIANELGISKATVSLCLKGSNVVADHTKAKVLQKIDELGYVYNRGAASLSTGESKTIGLAIHALTNPYFTQVCSSIESVLSQSGRMSFLCNTGESLDRQTRFLTELNEHNADGLILCPAIGSSFRDVRGRRKNALPTVLISRDIEDSDLDYVGNDDELSLHLATQHIIRQGHKRIAMLGGSQDTSVAKLRRQGFLSAIKKFSLPLSPELLIDCDADSEGGSKAACRVMRSSHPPTALVCFNDLVALGAISSLYEMGLRPGVDVAVIGCDDIEEGRRGYIKLSTIKVQKALIGQFAAEALIRRIINPDIPTQRIINSPELVIRDTCGFANRT